MAAYVICSQIQNRGIYKRRPEKSLSDSNARLNLKLTGLFVFTGPIKKEAAMSVIFWIHVFVIVIKIIAMSNNADAETKTDETKANGLK